MNLEKSVCIGLYPLSKDGIWRNCTKAQILASQEVFPITYFSKTDLFKRKDSATEIFALPNDEPYKDFATLKRKRVRTLDGISLLAQTYIDSIESVLHEVEQDGGHNTSSAQDYQETLEWPNSVDPEFLGRSLRIVTPEDACNEELLKRFNRGNEVFIKTKDKSAEFGGVFPIYQIAAHIKKGIPYRDLTNKTQFRPISEDDRLIISEPIDIEIENDHTVEYRFWVINGEVTLGHRQTHISDLESPSEAQTFATKFAAAHKDKLPRHYMLDLALKKDGTWTLIELNPMVGAGVDDSTKLDLMVEIFKRIYTEIASL